MLGLLVLTVVLLEYFQYTTLEKFRVLEPAVRYEVSRKMLAQIAAQAHLTRSDAVVFGLIVTAFIVLIALELRSKRVTALLRYLFAAERRTRVGLCLAGLVLVRFYFSQGVLNWAGDGSSHICYAWIASQAFSHGEIPIWTNYLGAGSPYLQFYGFLFFYVVGLTDQLIGNLNLTIKLVLATAHIASGLGMFCFIRRLCGSRPAGFIAGLAYMLCVWHMQQTLIMGRFPLSLFYALLPWPFYAFEILRFNRPAAPAIAGGGLTLGLLAFVHPGYAFWATAALGLYIAVRTAVAPARRKPKQLLCCSLALWSLGIAFGAYLTFPMWVERADVDLEEITHAAVPDPTWGHLFVWSDYRLQLFAFPGHDNWYGGYLGLSLVALAVAAVGLGLASSRHRRRVLAVGLCLAVSFVLVLGYRWPGIRDLAIVKAFNAGRYLLFVTFFLAAAAGVGAMVLQNKIKRRFPNGIALILLLILTDLGPTTFQYPYAQPHRTFLKLSPQFYQELHAEIGDFPNGQLPNFRMSYPMGDIFYLLGIAWFTTNFGIPSYLTGYREGPSNQSEFCLPVQKLLDEEFKRQDVTRQLKITSRLNDIMIGQYLLNTRFTHVFIAKSQQIAGIIWPRFSPIVVAPEAQPRETASEKTFTDLLHGMDVDMGTNTCARIYLSDLSRTENLGTSPHIDVLDHRVWNQRVDLRIRLSAPAFARLAYAYYPFLAVYVDNSRAVVHRTAGGFIALKLDAGEHTIVLKPYLSLLRRTLLILDALLLITAFIWIAKTRRKSHRSPGARAR